MSNSINRGGVNLYYFSIPCDFNIDTLEKIHDLNKGHRKCSVIETYGQITVGELISSGRMTPLLPRVSFESLIEYVKYCEKYNINFNYTLNSSCLGNMEFSQEGVQKIMNFVLSLYDIGVTTFTVALPSIIEIINSLNIDIEIKASAICEINSPDKAIFFRNMGVKRIVVDPDITRKFNVLQNIYNAVDSQVEIIINNVCVKNCAYKMFHYNHEAHCNDDTQTIKNFFFHRCAMQKAFSPRNIIKLNFIRPEDLHYYYESGIKHFKIQGRHITDNDKLIRTIKYYFDEKYDGDLMELITIFTPYNAFQPQVDNKKLEGFVDKIYKNHSFCRDNCDKCGYCMEYAKKSMDIKRVEELNRKSLEFYKNIDKYLKA